MSKVRFEKLSPEHQKILLEEAQKVAIEIRKLATQDEEKKLAEVKKHMEVNDVPDKQPFKDAVKPVYDQTRKQFGNEIFDKIAAAAK